MTYVQLGNPLSMLVLLKQVIVLGNLFQGGTGVDREKLKS